MEPTKHTVVEFTDKAARDAAFEDYRKDGSPEERQSVKFSSAKLVEFDHGVLGKCPRWVSTWYIATPDKVEKANHGSKRYPKRTFGKKT
jgi:hypothetical protein